MQTLVAKANAGRGRNNSGSPYRRLLVCFWLVQQRGKKRIPSTENFRIKNEKGKENKKRDTQRINSTQRIIQGLIFSAF
ncbi:hypothetical protein TCAL_14478 [Tigriopus californicus]|uniref:Uncharacterized protein n=1 Tax=Tigriopus californicus TaxID=6832 RepID=A0A553PTT1_TIGCA|nr:hypothetical protein TCAL_14478 [Tigriopus californicus]